jgi:hypothetical protein
MAALRELADRTPASRERYVDLLRAVAIITVVLGHWLISWVGYDEQGRLTGHSALDSLPWAFPITWVVQVMPVVFIVGGYANAASLTSQRRRGGTAVTWLLGRTSRLVRPTSALFLVLVAGAVVGQALGTDPVLARMGVWVAAIPLWFLAAYLVVVLATPLMYAVHRRYGWLVVAVLVVLVTLGDLARLGGMAMLGGGNFVFGWLAIHQIGFFWYDGRLRFGVRTGALVLCGGLAALLALTLIGPYPVSIIDVSGQRLQNASPPTLALLAASVFQLGLVILCHGPAEHWLRRTRPWRGVVGVNSVVFTLFLWHMSAVVLLVGVLAAPHLLPTPAIASTAWWLWRVPWLLLLVVALAPLVAIFGPLESRARVRLVQEQGQEPATSARRRLGSALVEDLTLVPLTVVAFAAVIIGLLINNVAPRTGTYLLGMPTLAFVTYLAGAAVLRVLRRLAPRS